MKLYFRCVACCLCAFVAFRVSADAGIFGCLTAILWMLVAILSILIARL